MKQLSEKESIATEAQSHGGKTECFLDSVAPWLCGKSVLQVARLGLVLAACVIGLAAQNSQTPLPGPTQPIPFSHKLHAGEQNLKCATCHKNADPGERMGLASAAMCMQCHEDVKADSPAIQKLAGFAKDKREIRWVRVYEIPSYVFFSHRSHLNAGAACAECHGEVKELEQMYQAKKINMASCMNCHQAKGASVDCTFCHDKMN